MLELQVERPVAGGRMLARHEGVVVLVGGAIAGERVRARIEKRTKSLILAEVVEVLHASPSRRIPATDPRCGGMDYAHVEYDLQLEFKRDVITDAFRRIGKIAVPEALRIDASPEDGYRLRARLHVHDGRVGFFREGTHAVCDAVATRQLSPSSSAAVDGLVAWLGPRLSDVSEIILAENVSGTERVAHLAMVDGAGPLKPADALVAGFTGITASRRGRFEAIAGVGTVSDAASDLFFDDPPVPAGTTWRRHAASFFQGNRFLTGALVRHVIESTDGARVADLYAGVGLFAVALAACGTRVVAVEGDPTSGRDLDANARPFSETLEVVHGAVEDVTRSIRRGAVTTIVCDPPRTGLSPEALSHILAIDAPRVVYVSCDPATLARDAARMAADGYRLLSLRGFDLFPNTSHVESVAVFGRSPTADAS